MFFLLCLGLLEAYTNEKVYNLKYFQYIVLKRNRHIFI